MTLEEVEHELKSLVQKGNSVRRSTQPLPLFWGCGFRSYALWQKRLQETHRIYRVIKPVGRFFLNKTRSQHLNFRHFRQW